MPDLQRTVQAYRVAGFRSGWMALSGPKHHATSFIEGLNVLANMRLCANVPAQHAIATALGGRQSITDLVLPGGRLREQRDIAWSMLNQIPGVSCTKPEGALYLFPRLDPEIFGIVDDQRFALDLLREQHILVVHGTGFNWPTPDHFRIVTLPRVEVLTEAIGRLGSSSPATGKMAPHCADGAPGWSFGGRRFAAGGSGRVSCGRPGPTNATTGRHPPRRSRGASPIRRPPASPRPRRRDGSIA